MTDEELLKEGLFDELYLQMLPIIHKHIKNKYLNLEYEDRVGRCNLVFSKVIKTYKVGGTAKLSTYFMKALNNDFIKYLKYKNAKKRAFITVSYDALCWDGEKEVPFIELIQKKETLERVQY